MKKSSRIWSLSILMMICLCMVLSIPSIPVQAADNLSENEMIYGADIGFLSQLESQGVEWVDDNGNTRDALELLKEKGVNAVRLRVFVKPPENFYWTKPDGTNCMLGYADTQGLLYTAKRAKELGLKIMVVFHYSDHFADPLIQDVPSEWENASTSELEKYVYDYTKYIMTELADEDIYPEWVQVGNEVSYGMLYPTGSNQSNDFTQLTKYLNSGYDAVKSISPNSKVVTHLTHGSGISHFAWFFENFIKKCGGKTDVIGMSYYPYWTSSYDGDCIENVAYNLNKMASQYGKDVMICETGELESNSQGTYELLRKEINAVKSVPNNKGIGVFYWEPELNSSVVPDGYTLGATELVGNNKLHFTNALNAFKLAPDYLNTDCSYEMMNINSQKSVNIATGSQDNNAQVEQYTYDQWDSQKWIFEKVDSSYYKIVNKNSGKVLDVCGLSQNENAQVVQYEYNGGWNQQWKITTTSDGKYKIQNRWSGLYLGVLNNSTNDGASIVQVSDESSSSEWFILLTD